MLTLVCAAAVAQVPVEQPPRLRTILPSGAIVLVERVPKATSLSVGLFVSARSTPETPATHGYRHLIEHLVAPGQDGKLDRWLESQGGFMRAQTNREVMSFLFNLPPGGLRIGMEGTASILKARITDPGAVERENRVMAQEFALQEPTTFASREAWQWAYGAQGLDPLGDLKIMARANPAVLESIRQSMFAPSNLVLVITGDVDLDAATAAAKQILPVGKATTSPASVPRKLLAETATHRIDGYVAIPVPGFRRPETTAVLAASLALASEIPDSSVVYTPSGQPGVILVGCEDLSALKAAIANSDAASLFGRSRNLVRRWVRFKLANPEQTTLFRGMLLSDSRDLRPETMLENLETMTYPAFAAALKLISEGGAS